MIIMDFQLPVTFIMCSLNAEINKSIPSLHPAFEGLGKKS